MLLRGVEEAVESDEEFKEILAAHFSWLREQDTTVLYENYNRTKAVLQCVMQSNVHSTSVPGFLLRGADSHNFRAYSRLSLIMELTGDLIRRRSFEERKAYHTKMVRLDDEIQPNSGCSQEFYKLFCKA